MARYCPEITITRDDTRLCTVKGQIGYFHCWEQFYESEVESHLSCELFPGPRCHVSGIVEFPNGIERIDPELIMFCDEKHKFLVDISKRSSENNGD